jgi:hypothetical protein
MLPRTLFRAAVAVAAVVLTGACARTATPPEPVGPPMPNTLTAAEQRAGWRLLFDGETMNGWHTYAKPGMISGWAARDGMLVRTGPGGDIVTNNQYDSFELELEWKVGPKGNSGIFYWAHEASEKIYHNAPEYQVLDNEGHRDGLTPMTAAGSLYGLYPSPPELAKPAGEWNITRIVTKGGKVEHWLNNRRVVEADFDSDELKAKIAASKFAQWPTFGKTRRGYIGIQDHGDDGVWYRNIKIRVQP